MICYCALQPPKQAKALILTYHPFPEKVLVVNKVTSEQVLGRKMSTGVEVPGKTALQLTSSIDTL